jgi:transcription initiation factor IIF auxiliary subunit
MMQQVVRNYTQNENIKVAQSSQYQGNDSWTWSVWMEGPDEDLDTIETVVYTLHPTFTPPVISISTRANKFRLDTRGWGTFTIYVTVKFKDGKVMELEHELELNYPFEDESPKEEVMDIMVRSADYQKIMKEIEGIKSEMASTEFPEYRTSLEKKLELKQVEMENLRSNINTLIQTFNSFTPTEADSKVEKARFLFDKGDYLAATEAME